MPDRTGSVAKNITVLMGSQAVTWVSTFLLMIVLPRYLGSGEYGRLYLAMSLGMMALVFVDFGGSFFIAKEVARDHEGAAALISNSIGLRLVLSIAAIVLCLLFAFLAGYTHEVVLIIAILVVAKLWEGVLSVFVAAFQGFERLEYRSITSIVERVFLSVVAVTCVLLGGRSVLVALIMAMSTLISAVVGFRLLRRVTTPLPSIEWRACPGLARKGIPYLMLSVFAVIYFRINTVMLSLQTTDRIVGWFGAAFRFFDILMFLPTIVNLALFPVLSRVATDREAIARTTRRGFEMMLLAALPVCVGTYAFADVIIRLLFGATEFSGSIPVLQVLAFGIPFIYVDFILVSTLIAVDRQRAWSYVALGAIPVSMALNAVLIPVFQSSLGNGGVGSALATDMTEVGIMVAALLLMPRHVLGGRLPGKIWRILLAGGAMGGSIWGVHSLGLPWYFQAMGGAIVYVAISFALGVASLDDLEAFRPMFSPRGWKEMITTRTDPVS